MTESKHWSYICRIVWKASVADWRLVVHNQIFPARISWPNLFVSILPNLYGAGSVEATVMHPLAKRPYRIRVQAFNFEIVDPPWAAVQRHFDHGQQVVAGALQQAPALDVAVEGRPDAVAGRRLTPR